MRIPRLYCNQPLVAGAFCQLSDERHHYLTHVLRVSVGDVVHLFNGDGSEHCYRIDAINRHQTRLSYEAGVACIPECSYAISLYLAVTKSQSISFAIQKAVELGVHSIYPVITEYSNYSIKAATRKLEHWHNIICSAAEQCGRAILPVLHEPTSLNDMLISPDAMLIALEPDAEMQFISCLKTSTLAALGLLVGPEGGFSESDKIAFQQCGFISANLGPRVLRTETAVAAALSISQAIKGDMGQ